MQHNPERFQIHSQHEIAGMLRSMLESRDMMRLRFAESPETMITCVLDVDLKNGRFFLHCATSPVQNRIALQSRQISCEAVVSRVRIAFRINRLRQASYNGQPALVAELPESIVRYQRRGHVRIPLESAFVRIPIVSGHDEAVATGLVRDISTGGMTVVDETLAIDYGVNAVHAGCQLCLPEVRPVMVNLRFRHVMDLPGKTRQRSRRIGCQFVDLADEVAVRIRRFVSDAERQIRMMMGDAEE
ncbi:flagellar brake protein [Oxalobacter sp. OttesenSCG-928-P03]|nr:flagellar brake protein [Oxalobacter sp. OttesenSCG-928-P03]